MIVLPGYGEMIDLRWIAFGVALSVPYVLVGRALAARAGRTAARAGGADRAWWWGGLVVAALAYVGFALARSAPPLAVLFEAGGVVAYGALGWLGVRGDLRWLAGAWLLHAVWDLGLHGPGGFALAPAWYVWACVGFDLVVGGVLLVTRPHAAG